MEEVIVIGSGMGALSAAAILAKKGLKPLLLEQNWIPGGCTTSYWRKGFVFEAGATTLVGLDKNMPLRHLLNITGINLKVRKLDLPMQVHLTDGRVVNKYENLEEWIREAERNFEGPQRAFWEKAYGLSQFVWSASTKYLHFPPASLTDVWHLAKNAHLRDLYQAKYTLSSTQSIVDKYNLNNPYFQSYLDEQLLITAQNRAPEVNFLFGAAALCYTNYGNYYVDGGLINLVQPIVDFIEKQGGKIHYREGVQKITKKGGDYVVQTKKETYQSKYLISGIPINNLLPITQKGVIDQKKHQSLMGSELLYSAFQMGIGFKNSREFRSLHHQIHLDRPLIGTGSKSIFISLSHEQDISRSDLPGGRVASISTHIPNPDKTKISNEHIEREIIAILIEKGFFDDSDIIYAHSSGPKSWKKWTGREFGFVGGYPQYLKIKPWQMIEARLDHDKAYQCGDTTYPGQGIPGASLSGIIAAQKLIADWL